MVRMTPFPPPQSGLFVVALFFISLTLTGCDPVDIEEQQTNGELSTTVFAESVYPVLLDDGCANVGCHDAFEGQGGAFRVIRDTEAGTQEMTANYISAKSFANINDPPNSKLLLEPLAGVLGLQGTHGGGDIFTSENEPGYQTILQWISTPDTTVEEN